MSTFPPQSISERSQREGATIQRSSTTPAYVPMRRSPPPRYTTLPFIGRRHETFSTQPASGWSPLQGRQPPRARMSSITEPMPPLDAQLAEFREGITPNTIPADSQAAPLTHRHRHEMARPQSLSARTTDDYRSSTPSSIRFPPELTRGGQPHPAPAQAEHHASPKQPASLRNGIVPTTPSPERKDSGLEEDVPPSPGSIASTAVSPSLLRKREKLEKELAEMTQDVKDNSGSLRSRKTSSPSLPAYSSPKNDSRSTLTARDVFHPSQFLIVPLSESPRTTTPLSYASHNRYMSEAANSNPDLPHSQPPPSPPTRQYHETPTNTMHPSSPPNIQTVPLHNGSRQSTPPLSSHLGSPQRSIPGHESPGIGVVADPAGINGSQTDSGPDMIGIYPPSPVKLLRRRDRESITNPVQSVGAKRNSDLTPARMGTGTIMLSRGSPDGKGYYSESTVSSGISQPAQAVLIPSDPSPAPMRTLDSVRSQVASEIAFRTISKASLVDGVRTGIADASSASGPDDISFVHLIASSLTSSFTLNNAPYLFLVTTTATPTVPGILFITSSSKDITSRAIQLCSSKFIGRLSEGSFSSSQTSPEYADGIMTAIETEYLAKIKNLNVSSFDFDILQFLLRSASRTPLDPRSPPPGSKSIGTILSEVRAQLQRITPRQAITELRDNLMDVPVILVDIRPQAQRDEFGLIRGALVIERNVLEWRFDPRCEARLPIADRYDLRVIVFCQEGYTSSLAAHSLQQLGLLNATDMIGGYKAWKDAGLPVELRPERSIASLAGSIV